MQNTQKVISAENVINMIVDFMNQIRSNVSISEIFTSTLAVLYACHKGYPIKLIGHHHIEFIPNEDKLHNDIVNLVPNDKHLNNAMCQLAKELSFIGIDEFNSVYVEVLRGLFDFVSSNSGREGEFYTPLAVTKLMAYYVNKEQCHTVYDPFCGTASIVHELAQFIELPRFSGQELSYKTSIYARLNTEALYGHDKSITNFDSITHWDKNFYDAVVSCPPLGFRLTQEQLYQAIHETPECPCRSFEEIILTRPFYCNHVKLTMTLLSSSFCFKDNRVYDLRRELIEHNLIDTIIALPSNILYGTSIASIILICKTGRKRHDPIKFIHAEDYFHGDRRKRTFDYNRFIEMIEGDACDVAKVSFEEVRQYDYNLNPALYYKKDFELKDGQSIVRLEDLICPIEGVRISSTEVKESVSISNLSRDFIEVLLNNGKSSAPSEVRRNIGYRSIEATGEKYLFSFSNTLECRFGINTDGKGFVYSVDIKTYKVNENLVTPEYLVYALINHKAISKGRMPLSGYMMLPIVIDSLEKQKELVNKEIQHYEKKANAEREADAMRLGVKQNVSDLEHMLGSTQLRINKVIARLEKATPSSENYHRLVKSMKDNVEYMNRIIHYNNAHIDSESFNMKKGDIVEFINDYIDSWSNYGGEYFDLTVRNSLHEKIKISFDKTLLIVMLDSILNNAVRHGFHKRKNHTEHNTVQISISVVEYIGLPYVLLSIANNGDPITDGFTIEDYTSRGRYTASTGRSGLGGHHVYQIVKGHNGFIYLDSNKVWNMIVDVLLPIESTILNDIPIYENECI